MSQLNLGIIGYRNHSQKLISIIKKNKKINQIISFCYKKNKINSLNTRNKLSNIKYTSNLKDLNNLDIIVISSATGSHIKYLKKFIKKVKYIYCEKPGAVNINEIKFLKSLNQNIKKKIFFGQNVLYSDLHYQLKKIERRKIFGKPLYSTINICNGISFKKSMNVNWRFTSKLIFKKITGNVGIHYLGLLQSIFGKIHKFSIKEFGINKKNKIDNSFLDVEFSNKFVSKIFLSYSTIAFEEIKFYFTNGLLVFDGKKLYSHSPRDVFEADGNFKTPKKKIIKKFNKSWSNDSLENSINFFLKSCLLNKGFKIKDYNNFLEILNLFLKRK